MNKIRFVMNYIITPIYLVAVLIGLTIGGILMSINEEQFTPVFIFIMIILGIITIALMASVPIVRKKELSIELAKNIYDMSNTDDKDEYHFDITHGYDIVSVELAHNGLMFDKTHFNYDEFEISLETTKYLNLINIYILFSIKDNASNLKNWDENELFFQLKLSPDLVYAIHKFNIEIENPDVLDYILSNREQAFKQIYNYGYIRRMN